MRTQSQKEGDLHLREAARLFKMDNVTRQIFGSGEGKKKLAEFEHIGTSALEIIGYRLIKHFRDKYTRTLGSPRTLRQ